MRVAFMTLKMPDFDKVGGGGAERQFAMLHKYYEKTDHKMYFLSTKKGIHFLLKLNIVNPRGRLLKLYDPAKRTRYRVYLSYLHFLWMIVIKRIQIIHTVNYFANNDAYFKVLKYLPKKLRPEIVINIMDCRMAKALDENVETENKLLARYETLFNEIELGGVYSWYQNFVEVVNRKKIIKSTPVVRATDYCFTDLQKYKPDSKSNIIVYAARLDNQKNPLMFLDAVAELSKRRRELFDSYEVLVCGKGPLEEEVRKRVDDLNQIIKIKLRTDLKDMTEVFSKSKIFVSTQELENFTSLSMLEAMAAGNVVVCRHVGQSSYFVRDGKNGFLSQKTDTVVDFGNALEKAINLSESDKVKFSHESIKIATEEHTILNFVSQLNDFYQKVLNK